MTVASGSNFVPGSWLEKQWYRSSPWLLILLPLSVLFWALSALRRMAYRSGWLREQRLPVPVIVVGNISVGGTGKTPLVLWLADWLRRHDFRPGIVSRGYGGRSAESRPVEPDGSAALSGDEPLLLARQSHCPVWIGRDRVAAGQGLLEAHPECNVLISDDGLQHYRLARDVEIAVVDGQRLFGNGFLLPAGPLREGVGRLRQVDAVVVNGDAEFAGGGHFNMSLKGVMLRNLCSGAMVPALELADKKLHAVAGIGNPQRFFAHLQGLGLTFERHPFPDHHAYRAEDLAWPDADAIMMTEKDAVKCAAFADERYWVLPVRAELDPSFGQRILDTLRKRNGRKTA
ncbi:tetraacyldisaccharide 4'-kinase [Sulfurimicrobium lacus]|uniref:Tetraacyldisaccharide 4'-kinase n=1 Tax=Sulfurimicrobium lacus TaxID=2715678 RepID=A0A6F8VC24_9PROT|nr:tetraacyldisaccharide 4'-kinase [Sulfurimicrobium lacus]BCB26289.1 tetraacyldisaccharide 4'-kinase [Sulfurimicrobium lacus]